VTIDQAAARDARRALAAGCVGNLVEWYDFALYGAFATVLATVMFPEADPVSALVATFAVFGVALVARPAGALLFAHYGDRLGRRRAAGGQHPAHGRGHRRHRPAARARLDRVARPCPAGPAPGRAGRGHGRGVRRVGGVRGRAGP
jgi:Sugar (and other) transporter